MDPVAFYRKHAERVRHFHFKDLDPAVHRRAVERGIGFLDAAAGHMFCPPGRGMVEWAELQKALAEHGYDPYATIEQDVDPSLGVNPLRDAKESPGFLREMGF